MVDPEAPFQDDPDTAVSPPADRLALRMIEPPERGNHVSQRWALFGIAVYLVLAAVFASSLAGGNVSIQEALVQLIGLGPEPNWTTVVLVVSGIGLFVFAVVYVLLDIREMKREEDDIQWLLDCQVEGLPLVFAPADQRRALYLKGVRSISDAGAVSVETLVDDRVRRVIGARTGTGTASVSAEELRAIAEKRTSRLGSFARYASTLLLLLAVLGTFAGVKTALPKLIQAVSGSGPTPSLVAPLNAVAEAFGANALALVGAIAVGLMAHGVGQGRRNLLERLELVSAEYIFGPTDLQSASSLEAAIIALRRTAEEIQTSTGALLGIEGGLESLGADFRQAFGTLEERLTSIVSAQENRLYDRTSRGLEELQAHVASLAGVIDANSRLYAGIVDQVGERAAEYRQAIGQLGNTSTQLAQVLQDVSALHQAAGATVQEAHDATGRMVQGTAEVQSQIATLAAAIAGMQPALQQVAGTVEQVAGRVATIEDRAAESWGRVSNELLDKISDLATAATQMGSVEDRVAERWSRVGDELLQRVAAVEAAASRMGTIDERVAQSWERTGNALLQRVAGLAEEAVHRRADTVLTQASPSTSRVDGSSREVVEVLQQILQAVESQERARPRLAAIVTLPLLGAIIGGGIFLVVRALIF